MPPSSRGRLVLLLCALSPLLACASASSGLDAATAVPDSGVALADASGAAIDAGPTPGSDASQGAPDASSVPDASVGGPKRLTPSGQKLLGPDGTPVLLYGANLRDNLSSSGASLPILTAAEADDLATGLSFNFVRLRLSFEQGNRDDTDPSGLSADARRYLADAVALLRARRIWMLLELRTDDAMANSAAFYDTASADFGHYRTAWTWLARTYRDTDYIAGYGLLAEPSPDRASADPVPLLIGFQAALMQAVSAEDPSTPFFVGPAFNYDTMGFRWDAYYDDPRLAPYRARLVYEVNVLMPKPWIKDGTLPPGTAASAGVWPQQPATDFSPLLTVAVGEGYLRPQDDEKIFGRRRQEPLLFPLLMTRGFLSWYLGFAKAFADRHQVPMVVDQFGASTLVNTTEHPAQQLAYEQDVIEVAEGLGMGWCRWVYASNPPDRSIAGNQAVHDFYAGVGAARSGP